MYDYIISRAFIPPWSLVMTKPETLGPDISHPMGKDRNPSFTYINCIVSPSSSKVRSQNSYNRSTIAENKFYTPHPKKQYQFFFLRTMRSFGLLARHDDTITRRIDERVKF